MSALTQVADDVNNDIDPEKLGPTKVLPHLYVGCMQDALSCETRNVHNITHVLNVTITCPKPQNLTDERFFRIPVNDGYVDKLLPHLEQACAFIDKVKLEGGCVLVHCMAGISRSAAVAIAYIMKTQMISCEQAYRFVKSFRPIVSPNFNFLGQLLEYEKLLNITTSPSSGAGSKRKRFDLGFPTLKSDAVSQTASPVHTKRLYVDNNNSISSLSPASALANLRFEHSLEEYHSSLPAVSSPKKLSYLPVSPLNPPKRCHSWNGLAELASSTESSITPKLRRGLGASRPRSLNLSMSNLTVPPALVELNAQVHKSLTADSKHIRSSSDISQITEELESIVPDQETADNNTQVKVNKPIFKEVGSTMGYLTKILSKTSDMSASQPTLSTPSPIDCSLPVDKGNTDNSCTPQSSKTNITSAHTAPSDLNKGTSTSSSSYLRVRRRSRSLENILSPANSESITDLCMKCGRVDKRSVCHSLSHQYNTDRSYNKPTSLHSSTEMIPVS